MTAKRWDFRDEDLRRYSVELEHSVLSGDRRIIANGREVFHGGKFMDTSGEHAFDIEGHDARVRISSNGFSYVYKLVVDGLTVPPEGMTIPRPAKNVPVNVLPQIAPERVPAEQLVVSALAQGPDPATLARVELVKRVENGGRWFYWIAGLSAVNFVLFLMDSDSGFALGTAIDWFVQVILEEVADPSLAWIPHVAVIALFAFFGRRATGGAQWAFIAGGLVYAADGLLFLLVQDWLGIAVHAFALFAIVNATMSLRRLRGAPLVVAPST